MKMFMLLAFLCIGFLLLAKIAGDYAGDVVFVITTVLYFNGTCRRYNTG